MNPLALDHPFDIPPIAMVRRSERADPLDNRKLRRALLDGTWTRVASGTFAVTEEWRRLTPIERHRVLVSEVARRARTPLTFARHAAAALFDIDVLGTWPAKIDVVVPMASGGRSSGAIRRHTRDIDGLETVPWGRHRVTTPAQTALDLARSERFVHGVAAVDQAIWVDRRGGPLTTRAEVFERLDADRGHRGGARAARTIAFAEPLAANVRESQSRVVVSQLGFPRPRLQERRVLRTGRLVFGDLYFPDQDHWCEVDGRAKYTDPVFLAGRTPAQAVIDEKNRENEIRREVRAFSRWEPTDADDPRIIWDILTGAGLPTPLPCP